MRSFVKDPKHSAFGGGALGPLPPKPRIAGGVLPDGISQSVPLGPLLPKPRTAGAANTKIQKYDFSGLALFSRRIFKEIKPGAVHIFKDVLESEMLKPHLRVYSVSGLWLLDMNSLSSYLKGARTVLEQLIGPKGRAQKKELFGKKTPAGKQKDPAPSAQTEQKLFGGQNPNVFLKNVLDRFSPGWSAFQGDNYFSAVKVENPPPDRKSLLFCGQKVRGLEHLFLKDFAVLGDFSRLTMPLCIERAVVGPGALITRSLNSELYL